MTPDSYIAITPVRNEEANLPATIASMVGQTITPLRWIIVDDGSSDRTGCIIDEAARSHPWIVPIRRKDRGGRKPGAGVVEAFYEGYSLVPSGNWDFLVKLDGDLSFDADYFEKCFGFFHSDGRLGIAGGTVCVGTAGRLVVESPKDPVFHVRGATKIYRKECWKAIGGLLSQTGWDTLDEVKANMLGWTTRTLAEVKLVHHRGTGEADGVWRNWFKNGRANYITGYHPVFMLLKCMKRIFSKPYGTGALGLMAGFVGGYITREPQVQDEELIQYLRRQQINRLLGKPSLWT